MRYYERVRLVDPEARNAANYRLYSEESLRKLKFIRAAQAIGFTLDDVKARLSTPKTRLRRVEKCSRSSKTCWRKSIRVSRICDMSSGF